jgi:histidyl-tRNA synthetase
MVRYQPPRGTRDFLPEDMVVRNHVEKVIRSTVEAYGFQQIQTPIFEQYDLLAARSGEEIKESMFTFASDAGRYALRPELTSPVCRLVASNALSGLSRPYKLYYFGPCFRYCRPQTGRYREFYQAGIELMGTREPLADAEAVAVAVKTLKRLGISEFKLRIGDVGIFRQLLAQYLGSDERQQEHQSHVISDIDKIMNIREKCSALADQKSLSPDDQTYFSSVSNTLHKVQEDVGYAGEYEILPDRPASADRLPEIAEATYRASWVAHGILPEAKADLLLAIARVRGASGDAIQTARQFLEGSEALKPLEDLSRVCDWLPALGVMDFEVVLGMARNLDFYTGTVFEIDSSLLGAQRQLCGGGRYDKLVEEFGGQSMPATGFAFGFDRLVEAFKKSGNEIDAAAIDVLVVSPPDRRRQAVELAERLRDGLLGLRVGVDLMSADLREQLGYCGRVGAAFAVLVGLDELGDQCKLRQGSNGPETLVAVSRLEEELRRQLTKKGRS